MGEGTSIITATEKYDKGPVKRGITNRENYILGVFAKLNELAANIPNITSVNTQRACKICREYNKHYN